MNNLKFAFRRLLKHPGFAMFVVLILGIGIGANTVVFSALEVLVLRSLPVVEPGATGVWNLGFGIHLGLCTWDLMFREFVNCRPEIANMNEFATLSIPASVVPSVGRPNPAGEHSWQPCLTSAED